MLQYVPPSSRRVNREDDGGRADADGNWRRGGPPGSDYGPPGRGIATGGNAEGGGAWRPRHMRESQPEQEQAQGAWRPRRVREGEDGPQRPQGESGSWRS